MSIQYEQIIKGIPARGELGLERRLVELRVAEGGEACGAALHGGDEALLAYDHVRGVVVLAFRAKSSAISDSRHTASSGSFRRRRSEINMNMPMQAKVGSPVSIAARMPRAQEIDRGRDRLRPDG